MAARDIVRHLISTTGLSFSELIDAGVIVPSRYRVLCRDGRLERMYVFGPDLLSSIERNSPWLPTGELGEERAIRVLCEYISRISPETWCDQQFFQHALEEGLRRGGDELRYDLAIGAIDEAKAGNETAHAALMTIVREMMAAGVPSERWAMHVWAYGERFVGKPFKRRRGRARNLARDLIICLLVILAHREFGVLPTRSRKARHHSRPSSISLVVEALFRTHKYPPTEASVQENLWKGLPGRLACKHSATLFGPHCLACG